MLSLCLLLFSAVEGHGFFYTPSIPPSLVRLQGYGDPQNSVGYSYDKPSSAWSHQQYVQPQQLILTPIQKLQHLQQQQHQQLQQQQVGYDEPSEFLRPPQSNPLAFNDPKYEWSLQPAIKYQVPGVPHPFFSNQRDPQQAVSILVPLRLFGVQSFPPFLERLIQRVQTYYSVYNPADTLTVPYHGPTPPTPYDIRPPVGPSLPAPGSTNELSEEVDESAGAVEGEEVTVRYGESGGNGVEEDSSTSSTSTEESGSTDASGEDATTVRPTEAETSEKSATTEGSIVDVQETTASPAASSTTEAPATQETTTSVPAQTTTGPIEDVQETTTEAAESSTDKEVEAVSIDEISLGPIDA